MKTNAKQEPAAVKYNQSLKVCGLSAALCDAQPAHVRSRTQSEAARLLPSAPVQRGPFVRRRTKPFPTPAPTAARGCKVHSLETGRREAIGFSLIRKLYIILGGDKVCLKSRIWVRLPVTPVAVTPIMNLDFRLESVKYYFTYINLF